MSGVILELQREATSQNCDVLSLLRKAHLVATKLNLRDFDYWISNELNGYKNNADIPNYRCIHGEFKAYNPYVGWIPAMFADIKTEKLICNQKIDISISEIISLCEESKQGLILSFSGVSQQQLNTMFNSSVPMKCALHFTTAAAKAIIDHVKTTILEWTIKLEKEGILGENMVFNADEQERAQKVEKAINNFYGNTNVINGNTEKMQILSGNNNNVSFTDDNVKELIAEIKQSLQKEDILKEDKETALDLLEDINSKIGKKGKNTLIQSLFIGMQNFLIATGATVTAELLKAKLQGYF